MVLVLDSSAAVRTVIEKGDTRWSAALQDAELVLAPDLLAIEAANAFSKYVSAGMLSRDDAGAALRDAIALVDEFHPMRELAQEAFGLGVLMKRSVYDLAYLALARRLGASLLTADKGLREAARRSGVQLV